MSPLISAAAASADRRLYAALLAIALLLPLPAGANSPLATGALGLVLAVMALLRLRLASRGLPLPPLPAALRTVLLLSAAWVGWIALQLLPLPGGLVRLLSPAAHALRAPLGAGAMPLSLDSDATLQQLVLSATYALLLWLTAVLVARRRDRQRGLLVALLVASVLQALYGSLMTLSGLELGAFAKKTFALGRATGTFVNPNHFAGYLEIGLAAGIALILADLEARTSSTWRERLIGLLELALSRRLQVRLALVILVIALVLSRSRGGNLAFVVALGVCANLYVLLRARSYFVKSLLLFASLLVVDLFIVSRHYGLERLADRLEATDVVAEQRSLAWGDLEPALQAFPLTGSGLGTFAVAFTPYRSAGLHGYFDHAHNDHLEFILETGVAGYAMLLTIAAACLLHALALVRGRRDRTAAALGFAGGMALLSLAVHGLADFNLHIPAVAASLVLVIGAMLSCSSTSSRESAA